MDSVSHSNKEISSKTIWLLMIPFFNTLFLHFYVTIKVYASIKNEFISRRIENELNSSLLIQGILMCITGLPATAYLIYNILNSFEILDNMDTIFSINLTLGLLNLIFWFIYWYRITKIASLLRPKIDG